ncbi:MAG TPA: hypothetical protein VGG71_15805 [Chitinophagaceae bacterium]|jgi:hypothetical protein
MKKYFIAPLLMLSFCMLLFSPGKLLAQAGADTLAYLKPFVGKYQFTDNKMVFLQIMLKDGHMVLKQLWDQQEIPFKQTSELEFYNDEHKFPLKFTKSSTGEITQVLAFNKDQWNRVADNYVPPMKKIIQLTDEQLKIFPGKYDLKGGDGDADDIAEISVANGHLVVKHEQEVTNLFAIAEFEFVTENQSFDIVFSKAADGSITQAVVNNRQVWLKSK